MGDSFSSKLSAQHSCSRVCDLMVAAAVANVMRRHVKMRKNYDLS